MPATDDPSSIRRLFLRLFPPLLVLPKLSIYIGGLGVYCLIIGLTVPRGGSSWNEWGTEASVIAGLVLGFLVSFRNNAAFARWWEARGAWGRLINETRNLAFKARAHLGRDAPELPRFGAILAGFAFALKDQLRGESSLRRVPGFENDPNDPADPSMHLAGLVFDQLADWKRREKILPVMLSLFDNHAVSLMEVRGVCERVKNTPIPVSYRALLRRGLVFYALLTPVTLEMDYGWYALPIFLVANYFLIGIELTAESVEEPFGLEGDDLDLDRFCLSIYSSMKEILGA